jgi:Kef-type K+ transport system membrane component KefB
MSLSSDEAVSVLVALCLLLVAAHAGGQAFARLRQPRVIGEIAGGLLLGPTVLGAVAPGVQQALFPAGTATAAVLGGIYQLGLLFLMFEAGQELRAAGDPGERRTVGWVTGFGLVLPLGLGAAAALPLDAAEHSGPAGTRATFVLVFGIAIAVTSIPVISRIMLDLGILSTPFARTVLTVAVLEDLVLYVLLAVTLGLAQARTSGPGGVVELLGVESVAALSALYVLGALVLFAAVLLHGGRAYALLARLAGRREPTVLRLTFLLAVVLSCAALSVNPVFGALAAGMSVARGDARLARTHPELTRAGHLAQQSVRRFSLAFFVPLYFALVGLSLDLRRDLEPWFCAGLFLFGCAVKGGSVWIGARVAGQDRAAALDLAVALNARGGPGIVLASVTLAAGVIDQGMFTSLVLLSVLSSQAAGVWLRRVRPSTGTAPAVAATVD